METADEQTEAPAAPVKAWHDKLQHYDKSIEADWSKQRENINKLYSREGRSEKADREYSIFWANIEVLKPAIYARPPVPVVTTRFKDAPQVGRSAAEVLERACVTTFDRSDINSCLVGVRDDFLMYGRGTARVRLGADNNGVPTVVYDHFSASDFAHGEGRTWNEVQWVAFRAWLTRQQGEERFGEAFKQVPIKRQDPNSMADSPEDKAPVWEIWCRSSGKVYFVNEDYAEYLDIQDPWLDLTSFWPCPRPAYSTVVPGKLKPVPDIRQYKDQIEEINEYTARIAALSQAVRVRGFYPAGVSDLSEAIEAALKSLDDRAVMIPVSSNAMLGAGQTFKDTIVWLPVVEVLQVIQGLVDLRRVVIEDVYQITGISDIVRGQSEASETATAQQIKAQWGSVRIRERQGELARFARDLTRMTAEIIAENFPPEVVFEVAQMKLPSQAEKMQAQALIQQAQQYPMIAQQAQAMGMQPPPQPQVPPGAEKMLKEPSIEEVAQFLADDRARGFVIDVETDSTIQPDEDAEKQRRMEFVQAVGGLFQQAAPIVMQAPQLGPFMGEVLKFAADGFRAGRPLQGAIDQLTEMLEGMAEAAMKPQPPQPDPKLEAEKVKLEGVKAKTEADMAMAQAKQQQTVLDAQVAQAEHQMTMEQMAAQQAAAAMMPAAGPNQSK